MSARGPGTCGAAHGKGLDGERRADLEARVAHHLRQAGLWDEVMIADLTYFDGNLARIDRVPEEAAVDGGLHFSSLLDLPSRRRATISCWICCVPSKMSRIFESRDHFSSSSFSP